MSEQQKYNNGDKVTFKVGHKIIKGVVHGIRYQETDNKKHNFEYIVIPEDQHKNWHKTETDNKKHEQAKPLPELDQYILTVDDIS